MKRQKVFSLLQLLIEVAITLFIAGIVVPSLLRSGVATNHALAAGSLHTIRVAGVVLSYTNHNVDSAILGAFVGAVAALAIPFSGSTPKSKTTPRTIPLRPALLRH